MSNTGNNNTGDHNVGHSNSGNYNSGDFNSGSLNSGHSNSGRRNSGSLNSGYYNSGNYNSGSHNSGSHNSGYFNTDEPTVRMFNKDTDLKRGDINIPYINLPINEWITVSRMTTKQKADNPEYKTTGGFLLTRTYKEAWSIAWKALTSEDKQKFLDLPNFDAEIFKEITGICVANDNCSGKIVVIDGKKYRLEKL